MSSSRDTHQGRLRELPERDCWERLARRGAGRLAYVEDAAPVIVPLNFMARDGRIWLRTASYHRVGGHVAGQQVAFEVDDIDDHRHSGWSVLVRGRVEHAAPAAPASWSGRTPWPDGIPAATFCLTPSRVTGRSFVGGDTSPAPGHGPGTIQRSHPAQAS